MRVPDSTALLLLLSLSLCVVARAQVVNIERLRLDRREQGVTGSLAGNLDLRRNQRSVFSTGADAHVQLRRDSNVTLVVGKAGVVKASGAELVNFAFAHLRYTHYVTDFLSLEAFTQLQQNRVNGIASRWLVGVGPRGRLFDNPRGSLLAGLLVMREREREVVDSIPVHRDVRLSAYLAGSYTPERASYVSFANTTYFQPRVGRFADIRIASDWVVQVKLRDDLALTTTFNVVYDARPPVGLERTVYALSNGIRLTFG